MWVQSRRQCCLPSAATSRQPGIVAKHLIPSFDQSSSGWPEEYGGCRQDSHERGEGKSFEIVPWSVEQPECTLHPYFRRSISSTTSSSLLLSVRSTLVMGSPWRWFPESYSVGVHNFILCRWLLRMASSARSCPWGETREHFKFQQIRSVWSMRSVRTCFSWTTWSN